MTSAANWFIGIILPTLLLATVAKVVGVRAETRRRNAEKTARRLGAWLRTSEQLVKRHTTASQRIEDVNDDLRWRKRLLKTFYGIPVAWLRMRNWLGNYLDEELQHRVRDQKTYMVEREREYQERLAKDKAAARKMIKTSIGLDALLGTDGRHVGYGVIVTFLVMTFAWGLSQEASLDGIEWVVGIVLFGTVVVLHHQKGRAFAWGCALVVYLCLTTLDASPLAHLEFRQAIDAQRVNVMFIGVAIMLTLCQFFGREGALGDIGEYERQVISESDGLTKWARITGAFASAMRRREGWWIFVALAFYGLSIVYFVYPILDFLCWSPPCSTDGRVEVVSVAAIATLGLPLISVSRAARVELIGLVVGVGTVALVITMWGVNEPVEEADMSVKQDTVVTIYPVVTMDTSVVEQALPAADLDVLGQAIWFRFESDGLSAGGRDTLSTVMEVVRKYPTMEVRIEGHADESGDEEFNIDLGTRRANAVLRYLTLGGLDSRRFAIRSYGESAPVSEIPARNRRVEFTVAKTPTMDTVVTASTRMVIEVDTVAGLGTIANADTIMVIEVR